MTRLEAIASQILPCDLFVDIGTDHGYIAQKALKFAKKVIASDISDNCLVKARELLADYRDRVEFRLGDGLGAIEKEIDYVDCISICGMGGNTICKILENYQGRARLILQPQNDLAAVRSFLSERFFVILNDFLCFERGKFYDIIVCTRGEKENLSDLQLSFGKFFYSGGDLGQKRLLGLEKKYSGYPPTEKNMRFLGQIRAALGAYKGEI